MKWSFSNKFDLFWTTPFLYYFTPNLLVYLVAFNMLVDKITLFKMSSHHLLCVVSFYQHDIFSTWHFVVLVNHLKSIIPPGSHDLAPNSFDKLQTFNVWSSSLLHIEDNFSENLKPSYLWTKLFLAERTSRGQYSIVFWINKLLHLDLFINWTH